VHKDPLGESLFHAWLSIVIMAGEEEESATYTHSYTIGTVLVYIQS
jgi:hypothetical protein